MPPVFAAMLQEIRGTLHTIRVENIEAVRNPPPPIPLTISQRVSSEALDKVSLLASLKDYFSAIQKITIPGKSEFLSYDYNMLGSLGFWKIPGVDPGTLCPVTQRKKSSGRL